MLRYSQKVFKIFEKNEKQKELLFDNNILTLIKFYSRVGITSDTIQLK